MEYELLLLNVVRSAGTQASHFRDCIGQHLIAAYLAERGFRAKVYSGDILEAEAIIRREMEVCRARYLGFYVGADNVVMTGHFIRHLKDNSDAYIFVGGPEAVALGEDFLRCTGCDAIIAGEGERPVWELLSCLEDGAGRLDQIAGLSFLNTDGVFCTNPPGEPLMDLDALPWPRREDSLHKRFRMGQSIGLLTGRGCPFHCAFCFEGAASKLVRLRSVENVMGEIDEVLSYNPSLRYVNFYDDTFTLSPQRVSDFCRELKKRGLQWTCEGHVSCLYRHPGMLETMVQSGLTAMQIGIESGSRRVLDAYQKHTTPEMIEEVVRRCHQAGLVTLEGNYIIGGAFEDNGTLEESLNHAKRLLELGRGMMEIKTVFFAPYYGTPITKAPEQFGMRLLPDQAAHTVVSMQEPVVETQALGSRELSEWKRRFDSALSEQYRKQAALCTRGDILRSPLTDRPMQFTSVTWYSIWRQIPHLHEFLNHISPEEQTCSPEKYPIRTWTGLEDGQSYGISLTPLQEKAVRCADGRSTCIQLAEELGMSAERLCEIYRELNRLCLVYFARF